MATVLQDKKMHSGIEIGVFSFLCPLAISRCLPSRPLSRVVESGTAVSASLRGQQPPMLQSFANRETRTTVLLQTSSRRQGLQSLMNKKLKTKTAVLWKQKLENEDAVLCKQLAVTRTAVFCIQITENEGSRPL